MNQSAVIVDAIRTPMGKYGGALSAVRPDDMLALLLRTMLERNPKVDVKAISDIIAGCANQAGEDSRNVARMAAIIAGFPFEIPGQTVNRLCGSSMQAVMTAAATIQSGWAEFILAGGVESMSRGPLAMPKPDKAFPFGSIPTYDTSLGWRFPNPKIEARVRP
ncbi:3-oxoadipyl-CoA thiolase, partial [bacterium]|nr:3-oxoadipyl-CoA thiolase [bacterium]